MDTDLLTTHWGEFTVRPLHHHLRSPLRAWNAADELLLAELATAPPAENAPLLLVNDSAGVLATALHGFNPVSWNDQVTSRLALAQNLALNALPCDVTGFVPGHQAPEGHFDTVLIQLPKTLSLLQHQLCLLRAHIGPDTRLIGAGMLKHMPKSMIDLFELMIGPTRTSLAQKKARLVYAQFDSARTPIPPEPVHYSIPDTALQLINHANVFSRHKLDIGTRFLLENLPDLGAPESILDLGCGNGALGIYAGWRYPAASLHFVDDSYLALHSAQASLKLNGLPNPACFYSADCLTDVDTKVDVILCNPPFHEGNKMHTDIANRMFRGAAQHLNPGGMLLIVANRHLDYSGMLKRDFQRVQLVTSNAKFVIAKATR